MSERVAVHIDATGRGARLALRLSGPSLHAQLGRARRRVAAWLCGRGLDDETVDDVVLAVHEALANAADHAFPDGDGEVWVSAHSPRPGELSVVVEDSGRWRPPAADPGTRGHGLRLIAGLAQRSAVATSSRGTRVEMYWGVGA